MVCQRVCVSAEMLMMNACLHVCIWFIVHSAAHVNSLISAEVLQGRLNDEGWPASCIAGGQAQQQRLGTMPALRDFHIRVLISTDDLVRDVYFMLCACWLASCIAGGKAH